MVSLPSAIASPCSEASRISVMVSPPRNCVECFGKRRPNSSGYQQKSVAARDRLCSRGGDGSCLVVRLASSRFPPRKLVLRVEKWFSDRTSHLDQLPLWNASRQVPFRLEENS